MANPMQQEKQIFETIQKQELSIDPIIWDLIFHHLRNDLQVINLGAECILLSKPNWIWKLGSIIMRTLYKLFRYPGKPPYDIFSVVNEVVNRVESIDNFLKKLNQVTSRKEIVAKEDVSC